jgi:glyoxylase-like metal-dependent hydrolase (beta-lactamase superfamily II)
VETAAVTGASREIGLEIARRRCERRYAVLLTGRDSEDGRRATESLGPGAWLDPTRVTFEDGPWETFDASHALTSDGRIRLVPTPGHTNGHLSVVVDRGDDLVLIAGDAAYSDRALVNGAVDGGAQDGRAHRDTTRRLRELCQRRRVITQFAHDPQSADRLATNTPTTP